MIRKLPVGRVPPALAQAGAADQSSPLGGDQPIQPCQILSCELPVQQLLDHRGDVFFAPVRAVQRVMQKEGKTITDYDLIEANEAFAVQALADGRALGWDWDRVNVNGGAIALGHPIGASGARVLVTLLHALEARNAHSGLATLCLGGGDAVALSVERV